MTRLVLDFVLSREGLTLESFEPIFLFDHRAAGLPGHRSMLERTSALLCVRPKADPDQALHDWVAAHHEAYQYPKSFLFQVVKYIL